MRPAAARVFPWATAFPIALKARPWYRFGRSSGVEVMRKIIMLLLGIMAYRRLAKAGHYNGDCRNAMG